MKKRGLCLGILILILLSLFSSCADSSVPDRMFIQESNMFFYNDLFFYIAPGVEGGARTLKYISLSSEDEVGVPVYSDLLNEGGDPFRDKYEIFEFLVDIEGAAENGGYPVIICSVRFDLDDGSYGKRLISYNMATGKTKVLCENTGDGTGPMYLYGDRIYYEFFDGTYDMFTLKMDGEFSICSIPKSGGEPTKLPIPIKDEHLSLKYAYKDKLYIETESNELYCCDLDGNHFEKIASFDSDHKPLQYAGGYVYYKGDAGTKIVENDDMDDMSEEKTREIGFFNYYRQRLDGLKEFTEKSGEKIVENVHRFVFSNDQTFPGIYYVGKDDNMKILRYYDLETKKTSIIYDYTDVPGTWYCCAINKKYMIIDGSIDDEISGEVKGKSYSINRETGKKKELRDWNWPHE